MTNLYDDLKREPMGQQETITSKDYEFLPLVGLTYSIVLIQDRLQLKGCFVGLTTQSFFAVAVKVFFLPSLKDKCVRNASQNKISALTTSSPNVLLKPNEQQALGITPSVVMYSKLFAPKLFFAKSHVSQQASQQASK